MYIYDEKVRFQVYTGELVNFVYIYIFEICDVIIC